MLLLFKVYFYYCSTGNITVKHHNHEANIHHKFTYLIHRRKERVVEHYWCIIGMLISLKKKERKLDAHLNAICNNASFGSSPSFGSVSVILSERSAEIQGMVLL